ncbi:Uncharacterised protein [Mycobacteroides abscessus subsp. bolletii]|nr:Uncharacterised protein [Mycobacteroides abscessus subsp. bolletii]
MMTLTRAIIEFLHLGVSQLTSFRVVYLISRNNFGGTTERISGIANEIDSRFYAPSIRGKGGPFVLHDLVCATVEVGILREQVVATLIQGETEPRHVPGIITEQQVKGPLCRRFVRGAIQPGEYLFQSKFRPHRHTINDCELCAVFPDGDFDLFDMGSRKLPMAAGWIVKLDTCPINVLHVGMTFEERPGRGF